MAVLVKTTQDGRRVEVIDGAVCLDGKPEATRLVPLLEHPNRQAIQRAVPGATHVAGRLPLTLEEAQIAQDALTESSRDFDASPTGIARRLQDAINHKARMEGIE
ncbi:hypothetical protein [Methyloversatilis thermotolerans]|jgi:hypothetical protein|uniref:hypothetical protein n=1 Tax=Methyloversatilis thermotolerans TaxID=1346290 RepID=UPI00035D8062|nr:hypothetical protein [Methyloversatilis thermotolerans]